MHRMHGAHMAPARAASRMQPLPRHSTSDSRLHDRRQLKSIDAASSACSSLLTSCSVLLPPYTSISAVE